MKIFFFFLFFTLYLESAFSDYIKFENHLQVLPIENIFQISVNDRKNIFLIAKNEKVNKISKIYSNNNINQISFDYDLINISLKNKNLTNKNLTNISLKNKNLTNIFVSNIKNLKKILSLDLKSFRNKNKLNRTFDYLKTGISAYAYYGNEATSFNIIIPLKFAKDYQKIYLKVPFPDLIETINVASNAILDYSKLNFSRDAEDEDLIFEIPLKKDFGIIEVFINYSKNIKKNEFNNSEIIFYSNLDTNDLFNLSIKEKISSTLSIVKYVISTMYQKYKFIYKNKIEYYFLKIKTNFQNLFNVSDNKMNKNLLRLQALQNTYNLDYKYYLKSINQNYVLQNQSLDNNFFIYDITDLKISSKLRIDKMALLFDNFDENSFFFLLNHANIYYFNISKIELFNLLVKKCFSTDEFIVNQLIGLTYDQKLDLLNNNLIYIKNGFFSQQNKIRGSCSNITIDIIN